MATVTLVPLIGTPPFVYLWKDGGDTISFGPNDVIFGLSGGTYTITVIDANGCIESAVFTIIEPTPIASAIIASNDVSCFGACDGSATVVAGGWHHAIYFPLDPFRPNHCHCRQFVWRCCVQRADY